MVNIVKITGAYRGIKSMLLIAIILLFRNVLNRSSIKRANKVLWTILLIFLLLPFSIVFKVSRTADYGLLNMPIKVLLSISDFTRQLTNSVADVLSRLNIYIIATLFVIYLIAKIVERNKALQGSKLLADNAFVNELLDGFHFKRKVTVLLNDNISTPVTYGIFKPKIVLQSYILEDEELLEHVLVHELTHIKYFDIAFTHIKNIALCLYWYNIAMWIASKLFEDDIEILCDKKVLERLGNTQENKKAYAMSMFKIIERENISENLVLSLNPQKERIMIMKEYRRRFSGLCNFILLFILSFIVFTEIILYNPIEKNVFNEFSNDKIDTLYECIETSENVKLLGLENKLYKFNLLSIASRDFDGIKIKINEIFPSKEINYRLTIKENNVTIYSESFTENIELIVNAYQNSSYELMVENLSSENLYCRIYVKSYVR